MTFNERTKKDYTDSRQARCVVFEKMRNIFVEHFYLLSL